MQGDFLRKLKDQIALQKDQAFLWSPVFVGAGIGAYFSLKAEPPPWTPALILALVVFIMAMGWRYRDQVLRPVYFVKFALILICVGFSAAQIRTQIVAAPVLEKKMNMSSIEGWVEVVEPLEEGTGSRIVLRTISIEGVDRVKTPLRVRLRLRQDMAVMSGQKIRILAGLNPPSGPVMPGGFDFRRHLYFSGIGAVGFAYRAPEILEEPQSLFARGIEGLRQNIGARIAAHLPPQQASVAMALMIGQQKALSDEDMKAIRDSGLAHMLSISGLHITLMAGVIFFLSRLMMAAIPDFALKHPIKKYAAIIAMAAAVFYMLIAGSTAPTVRSVLMIGVIFLAVILDRSPISLRLVSFAALMILLLQPENLLSVSFQMSFAAVAGLIAFFETTREMWSRWNREAGPLQRACVYLGGVCVTTLIATVTTTLFSIYHFQQFAFMGAVANLIAVPILSFFIMPFIVLAFFLMPLGLEGWALMPVGLGVDAILAIAKTCADLPHAVLLLRAIPFAAFILGVIGGLWIILWKGWGKTVAVLPVIAAIFLISQHNPPDILVSESHKLFGFQKEGALYVSSGKTDRFTRENWEKYYGKPEGSAIVMKTERNDFAACDAGACRLTIKDKKISYVTDPYLLNQECVWADIILSVEPVDEDRCYSSAIVDKFDTWRNGSHSVEIRQNTVQIQAAAVLAGDRPWVKKQKPRNKD